MSYRAWNVHDMSGVESTWHVGQGMEEKGGMWHVGKGRCVMLDRENTRHAREGRYVTYRTGKARDIPNREGTWHAIDTVYVMCTLCCFTVHRVNVTRSRSLCWVTVHRVNVTRMLCWITVHRVSVTRMLCWITARRSMQTTRYVVLLFIGST